jgi:hypothetical protein
MDEYVTSLLPGTQTSVSMVRDVRARLYEDATAISNVNGDHIPIKVDVETLYILEQKSEKKFLPSISNVYTTDSEQHESSVTTTIPISTMKVPHRPVGIQVNSTVEQSTVAAQTTDSLHRPNKERHRLPSPPSSSMDDEETSKVTKTTITTTRYEIKRHHSSHHSSEDEDNRDDNAGVTVIYIDDKDNSPMKSDSPIDDALPIAPEPSSTFGQVTSRIRIDKLRDLNRNIVRRQSDQHNNNQDEHRSTEVYEIHTRGACKCLVVSCEEKTQYGSETRFEKQLQRIERTYTDEELKNTELHVIVTTSDRDYQLVRRDHGFNRHDQINDERDYRQPSITVHYYTREGQRMRSEQGRHLEHLPLFIRCEIEYELNHYGMCICVCVCVCCILRNMSLKLTYIEQNY